MSAARPDTWMPLYIGDYLADTTHLTTEQHGAYFLLLIACWKRGGKLPNDEAQLAQITHLSPARWRAIRVTLLEFFLIADTTLTHKRIDRELAKAAKFIERQTQNGSKGGRPRKPTETQTKPTGFPEITTLPSPSPASNEASPKAPKGAFAVEFEKWWEEYPHKVGRPVALKSYLKARGDGVLPETLMAGLAAYKAAKPPDRPWCNPATWLNQQRWNDQPAPSTGEMLNGRHAVSAPNAWNPAYIGEGWVKPRGPAGPPPKVGEIN